MGRSFCSDGDVGGNALKPFLSFFPDSDKIDSIEGKWGRGAAKRMGEGGEGYWCCRGNLAYVLHHV